MAWHLGLGVRVRTLSFLPPTRPQRRSLTSFRHRKRLRDLDGGHPANVHLAPLRDPEPRQAVEEIRFVVLRRQANAMHFLSLFPTEKLSPLRCRSDRPWLNEQESCSKKMSRQLPPKIPVGKLKGIYEKSLQQLSDTLIAQIHEFIMRPVESDVVEAEFQIFPDENCDQESSIWMYFSGANNRVDSNDDRLFAGRSLEFFSNFSSLPALDLEEYENFDYANTLVSLIQDWFSECWWKAGGWYYPIPVVIAGHEGFGNRDATQLTQKKR